MLVTCICVCHNKPELAHEAIQSILDQTYPHWQAIIVDSGVLYDAGYYEQFAWRYDPRVTLIRSVETSELRRTKAMAPWCFNECFRRSLVQGDLVMYLCDDDILYPNAFASFVAYCTQHPEAMAMYASQDLGVIWPDGQRTIVGERRAIGPGGKCCNGRLMDCQVDYLQFCHRAEVLRTFPDEYWPEAKDTEKHADGIFMERIGEKVLIYPIDVKVSQNRRTPNSLNDPVEPIPWMDGMTDGEAVGNVRERCRMLGKAAARWRAEAESWRQQYLFNQSFVQSLSRSWTWRLLGPLRAIRRAIRPRGFDAHALIPLRHLERNEQAGAGGWVCTGPQACFIVPCEMPAGWFRLRVRMTSDAAGRFEILASAGNGISDADVVLQADVKDCLILDRTVHLSRPALGLQINPLGTATGRFELTEFVVTPDNWWSRLSSAIRA